MHFGAKASTSTLRSFAAASSNSTCSRPRPVDEERLAVALQTAESAIRDGGGALDAGAKARLVIAVYALVGRGGRVANAERLRELIWAARGGGGDATASGGS